MKKYSYIGIFIVILIFGIIVVPEIIDKVNNKEVVLDNRSDSRADRAAAAEELAYLEVNGNRKKVPDFEFIDQQGDTITNKDYEGKIYVVEFFFSTCPSICPVMKKNLLKVQKEFKDDENFGIASFSIDPTHDTPEVLKEYAAANGIEHANWHLLTGKGTEVYDLANKGFNIYAGVDADVPGGFAHSGYFALVDKEGFFRSRRDEFGNPIVYYRGFVEESSVTSPEEEQPETDILIQDIKNLMDDGV